MPTPIRRLTRILFTAQSLSSLGLTCSTTIGTLAAVHVSGQPALAGLPSALYQLGAALGAYPAGRFMDRFGRRSGLTIGFCLGVCGGLFAALSLFVHLLPLLLLGFALLGLGRSAIDQGRYAAAEIVAPDLRARAVSSVILGGTIGGIGGPLVIGPMGGLAAALGWDELAGPFVATAALLLAGSVMVHLWLRPDPSEIARQITAAHSPSGTVQLARRSMAEILRLYPAQMAIASMMIGQFVMVTVMVITPLYMSDHRHGLDAVSWIIAGHVFGMYAPSVVTGRFTDRYGRGAAIMLGAAVLMLSCFLAPLSENLWLLGLALFLLGLGWNLSYVAGSSLLADVLRPSERGRVQGTNDLLVGLVAASGTLGSGVLFATVGFVGITLGGILIALALLLIAAYLGRVILRTQRTITAD